MAYTPLVSDITSAIAGPRNRQIHLRRIQLACVSGAEAGRSWTLEQDVIRIGALPNGEVVLSDMTVSRRHAEVVRTKEGILLRDLGSTNGTFLGHVRIKEVFLAPETRFKVGRTEMLFTTKDEVFEVAPSREQRFEGGDGAAEPGPVAAEEVDALLAEIEGLTDDEVDRLLSEDDRDR